MVYGDLKQYKEILICVIVHESNEAIKNKKDYQCLNHSTPMNEQLKCH